MTDEELIAIIRSHRRESLGYEDGQLSVERATAMDHYHGRPYGNEQEGRSQVVSRDLAETVDWAMPVIMRAFTQSGSVGEFDPVGPEDEAQAQQESDYCNQVLMKDNNGFIILHDAVKDTLLLKNGYTKHYWDETEKISEEDYSGLTMEQVVSMLQQLESEGAEVDVKEADSEQVDFMGQPVELWEICLKIKRKKGKVTVLATPSEEIRVSKQCRGSLQDSPFTEHVTTKTRSELIEMGMSREFVDTLPAYRQNENSQETLARDSVTDESNTNGQSVVNRSMDLIEFCEAYIRVDYDGDGVAELRKVVTCANRIPDGEDWNEPIEAVAITGWAAKRVPHRHVGESIDDELADLQEIKTALHRSLMDNMYAINNNQWVVNERVNLKDFLTNLPGGVKRVSGREPVGDSVHALLATPIIDKILPAIDYWDKTKEIRTGIRPGSDLDPEVLQEVTKGAFMEHINRASQKIEMITRMLAETGLKELFLQVHGLLIRHQDKPRAVQMRGKWVNVNPQEWKERTDLTVRVGLGSGNEEEKTRKIGMAAQYQGQLMQAVVAAPPPVYAKMYDLFSDLMKALGFDNPEKYAVAPNSPEYQQLQQGKAQQPPNPELVKIQQQGQLEQQRMAMQQQVDKNRQEMEAQQQAAKMQFEKELAMFKAQLDQQTEQMRMQLKSDTDMHIARINAQAKLDTAQLTAQTTLSAEQENASDGAVDA